jgi:hypothetical protein
MDKTNIVSYWSYDYDEELNECDQIVNILSKYYSELNGLKLSILNLLNKSSNNYYWFLCQITGNLYYFNIIINNIQQQPNDINKITDVLSEINRYNFKQIDFHLKNINKNKFPKNTIFSFNISMNYYFVDNIDIFDKVVPNINKPSRNIRYVRRNILNKKRVIDNDNIQYTLSKKTKHNENLIDWSKMIPASSVRNYLLNDPLLDYLKEYNIMSIHDKPSKTTKSNIVYNTDIFTKHIMDAGIEFEEELFKIIKKEHYVVKVAEYFQARNIDKFNETIELMKQGVPIIYQGVLHDHEYSTYGLPDLIVRSDYLNKLMNSEIIDDEESNTPSPNLNCKWHYKIIDIKHSNIPLRSDGVHILNDESIPAYKGQLYIYMRTLNNILGININKAFIWGKKYFWEKNKQKYERTDFLNKLGVINYDTVDCEYIQKTDNAIKWIQSVREEGMTWQLLPYPSRQELYPNMKNEKDSQWRQVKQELNSKLNEITHILYCGHKQRNYAHKKQIFDWKNKKCTSKTLGFNQKKKQAKIVDEVLNINRQSKHIIKPNYVKFERTKWYNENNEHMEFYLDYETLNSNFGSIIKDGMISYDNNQYIFMVGLGYVHNDEWIFKSFIMKEKSENAELDVFNEFNKYVDDLLKQFNKKIAKFYHWSSAEPVAYNNFKKRNIDIIFSDSHYMFYDLYKVFINEPIVVNGALCYSLKAIAKALHKHSLIETNWDQDSPCSNGLMAMILANKIYDDHENKLIDNVANDAIMKEIELYNEVDCKVMYEIHDLMRKRM